MAANVTVDDEEDDCIVIECRDPNLIEQPPDTVAPPEIFISTAEISSWDLPSILTYQIVKIKINRTRQVNHSFSNLSLV